MDSENAPSFAGKERRRHRVYVTKNTEYHFRDGFCVAVRDRRTGEFLHGHLALRRRVHGGLKFYLNGGIVPNPGEPRVGEPYQAHLLISHPNSSGMQMDQLTRLYVPAHFVNSVRIWQGDDLLLAIEGGISISENPAFRFDYRPNGATSFRAQIDDSEGKSFKQEWPVARV